MSVERYETIPALKKREAESNKGDFGTVMVLGGGRGMAGAVALAAAGALRSGAGRVRVLCPFEVQPTVASFEPSYMAYPIADDGTGHIDFAKAKSDIERFLSSSTALAFGPGLGETAGTKSLAAWVVEHATIPTVIDADGLNCLVGQVETLKKAGRPLILTPHPKEFSRLNGQEVKQIQASREETAAAFAREYGVIVALKGSKTVVTDGKRVYVNTTGNPGMATGGSGDVLGGVIAALIGQGLEPFEATVLGVYAHGLAGDIARDQNGEVGLIAGDIVDSLADCFFHLGAG